MSATIKQASAFEDGGISLLARINGWSGTAINQAYLDTITLKVYEYDTEIEANNETQGVQVEDITEEVDIATVVFDSLQLDARWCDTVTGYNFLYEAGAECLPNGGRWYRFEFKLTPTSGAPFWVVWVVEAVSVASS